MIRKLFSKTRSRKNIALFVDGPNILRREFDIDLDVIRQKVEEFGKIKESKVFLNQFAPQKLVEAVTNQGFEPIIGMGGTKEDQTDVDVYLAVAAIEAAHHRHIDVIAIATRDADFLPVIQKVKEKGKDIIVIGRNPGFSKGLQHAADHVIDLTPWKDK